MLIAAFARRVPKNILSRAGSRTYLRKDRWRALVILFRGANIVATISLVVAFRDASTCIVRLLRRANIAAAISLVVDVFRNASTCLTASYKSRTLCMESVAYLYVIGNKYCIVHTARR